MDVYRLDYIEFYYYDQNDKENVEEIKLVGYFSSEEKLNSAINFCQKKGIEEKKLKSSIVGHFHPRQKKVYVLSLDYSILNNKFEDYYYTFPACKDYHSCILLRNQLCKFDKYNYSAKKGYYKQPYDGFRITTYTVNEIYYWFAENGETFSI